MSQPRKKNIELYKQIFVQDTKILHTDYVHYLYSIRENAITQPRVASEKLPDRFFSEELVELAF